MTASRPTIVVAVRDAALRDLFQMILRQSGCQVIAVADKEAARTLLRDHPIAAVVTLWSWLVAAGPTSPGLMQDVPLSLPIATIVDARESAQGIGALFTAPATDQQIFLTLPCDWDVVEAWVRRIVTAFHG